WLTWRSSEVRWNAVDADHTKVSWTLNFRRDLDPAWYFRPWERYAVHLAAEYLIENNATPEREIVDQIILIRAASLYVPVMVVAVACLHRPPQRRQVAGTLVACTWLLRSLLVLHLGHLYF